MKEKLSIKTGNQDSNRPTIYLRSCTRNPHPRITTCSRPSNTPTVTRRRPVTLAHTAAATGKSTGKFSRWRKKSTKSKRNNSTYKKTATNTMITLAPRTLWIPADLNPLSPTSMKIHPSTRKVEVMLTASTVVWISRQASSFFSCRSRTSILRILNRNRENLHNNNNLPQTIQHLISPLQLMKKLSSRVNIKTTLKYHRQYW